MGCYDSRILFSPKVQSDIELEDGEKLIGVTFNPFAERWAREYLGDKIDECTNPRPRPCCTALPVNQGKLSQQRQGLESLEIQALQRAVTENAATRLLSGQRRSGRSRVKKRSILDQPSQHIAKNLRAACIYFCRCVFHVPRPIMGTAEHAPSAAPLSIDFFN